MNTTPAVEQFARLPAELVQTLFQFVYNDYGPTANWEAPLLRLRRVCRAWNKHATEVHFATCPQRAIIRVIYKPDCEIVDGVRQILGHKQEAVIAQERGYFRETSFHFNNVKHLVIQAKIVKDEHVDLIMRKVLDMVVKCKKIALITVNVDSVKASFLPSLRTWLEETVDQAMSDKRQDYNVGFQFTGIALTDEDADMMSRW